MKKFFSAGLIFLFTIWVILPANAQEQSTSPKLKELWVGTELFDWLRGGDQRSRFIVPELSVKYRFNHLGVINLQGGYHHVKRDSLYFQDIAYQNKGWFFKTGPELALPLAREEATTLYFVVGANFIYSRFTEQAEVTFQYEPEDFGVVIDPANQYRYKGEGTSSGYAIEFYLGFWLTHGRFSLLPSANIRWLLNNPENAVMPVHYIPGFGIRTPQWDFFPLTNRNNDTRNLVFSPQLHLHYRLF